MTPLTYSVILLGSGFAPIILWFILLVGIRDNRFYQEVKLLPFVIAVPIIIFVAWNMQFTGSV
jgi:hypothetical protein